jgi:MFS transporter, SET family, sugar efflux transporter
MSALRLCLTDPALRAAGLVFALQGAVVCSFGPYFSVLAVNTFGFGDRGYAVLLALSSVVTVTASVFGGIRADQTANRRRITLAAVTSLLLGTFLMTVAPAPWVFALAIVLLFPVGSIVFGQVFALARLAASRYPRDQHDGIMAVIRALFALPFVIVLPLWSLVFAAGAPITLIFPVGLLLSGAMLLAVLRLWPDDSGAQWDDRPSGLSFRAALAEMGRLPVAARIAALGSVNVSTTIYMAVISLVMIPEVGRGTDDVALYVGLVAGLEVPFMLILPSLTRGWNRTTLILLGTALYCVHVALLPVMAGSALVWFLVLPAAIGGAVILGQGPL